jgi:hypothetical protein
MYMIGSGVKVHLGTVCAASSRLSGQIWIAWLSPRGHSRGGIVADVTAEKIQTNLQVL